MYLIIKQSVQKGLLLVLLFCLFSEKQVYTNLYHKASNHLVLKTTTTTKKKDFLCTTREQGTLQDPMTLQKA